ncbi:MAG: leucine zipper domain-containing protein [Thermoanaerobaculia bacterium]
MDIHKNARSCPASRELLVRRVVEQGWPVPEAAEAVGLSVRTGYKWLQRYKAEGLSGLADWWRPGTRSLGCRGTPPARDIAPVIVLLCNHQGVSANLRKDRMNRDRRAKFPCTGQGSSQATGNHPGRAGP